jgi:hypothetical protein
MIHANADDQTIESECGLLMAAKTASLMLEEPALTTARADIIVPEIPR